MRGTHNTDKDGMKGQTVGTWYPEYAMRGLFSSVKPNGAHLVEAEAFVRNNGTASGVHLMVHTELRIRRVTTASSCWRVLYAAASFPGVGSHETVMV